MKQPKIPKLPESAAFFLRETPENLGFFAVSLTEKPIMREIIRLSNIVSSDENKVIFKLTKAIRGNDFI